MGMTQEEQEAHALLELLAEEHADTLRYIAHWGDGYGGHMGLYLFRCIYPEENSTGNGDKGSGESKNPRKRLSTQKITSVLSRDGVKCQHCGTDQDLTIDHIVPVSKGGGNELENLQVLCKSCNSKKKDLVAKRWP